MPDRALQVALHPPLRQSCCKLQSDQVEKPLKKRKKGKKEKDLPGIPPASGWTQDDPGSVCLMLGYSNRTLEPSHAGPAQLK